MTIVLNLFIIASFAIKEEEEEEGIDRLNNYTFFRKGDWTVSQTKDLFFLLGIIMTISSLFVVVFFLSKIAPLIIKRAWS